MSCWRVLDLSDEHHDEAIPPLLIKPQFGSSTYTVFISDLSNIWSETLDLSGVVQRAFEVESPIEVTERDTSQLDILFENVQKSLQHNNKTTRAVTRTESDDVELHTTIHLPEPLDQLIWKFKLRKRPASALKDELILPLLVSSHIQHERIAGLLSVIADKDRALTRLIDQYESSNLDLSLAFPSIGNIKAGRRGLKRDQAARHIPGLQTFDRSAWKTETAELVNTDVSTLGLFQEALSECTPQIPRKLKSEDEAKAWWKDLSASIKVKKQAASPKAKTESKKTASPPQAADNDSETDEEETEDEFETHENFKTRNIPKKPQPVSAPKKTSTSLNSSPGSREPVKDEDQHGDQGDETDEEDDDLDAPPKSQSQTRRAPVLTTEPPSPEPAPMEIDSQSEPEPEPQPVELPSAKPKSRGFRIGGRSKKTESPPVELPEATASNENIPARPKAEADGEVSKAKKGFKIGGRAKARTATPEVIPKSADASPAATAPSITKEQNGATGAREETAEEKAERKRRELKRKNEELAKKQAQSKKKKRF